METARVSRRTLIISAGLGLAAYAFTKEFPWLAEFGAEKVDELLQIDQPPFSRLLEPYYPTFKEHYIEPFATLDADIGNIEAEFGGLALISPSVMAVLLVEPHKNNVFAYDFDGLLYKYDQDQAVWQVLSNKKSGPEKFNNLLEEFTANISLRSQLYLPLEMIGQGLETMKKWQIALPTWMDLDLKTPYKSRTKFSKPEFFNANELGDLLEEKYVGPAKFICTKDGVVFDASHIVGFARHSLQVFEKLNSGLTGPADNSVEISLDKLGITYKIDDLEYLRKNLIGVAYAIMLDASLRSEAISQLGVVNLPITGGASPEDVFTNCLSSGVALSVLEEASEAEIIEFSQNGRKFGRLVQKKIFEELGITDPQDLPDNIETILPPKNFYQLVPVNILHPSCLESAVERIKTPTPCFDHLQVTHTPAFKTSVPVMLSKIEESIH